MTAPGSGHEEDAAGGGGPPLQQPLPPPPAPSGSTSSLVPPAPPFAMVPGSPPPAGPPPPPSQVAGPGFGYDSGAPVAWVPPNGMQWSPGVPGAPGFRFGGVLHRLLAYWLDAIIVGLGIGIVTWVVGLAMGAAGGTSTLALVSAVVWFGAQFLYFVGFWTSTGHATPGMRLMKLQVGNAFDGRIMTMGQATGRWVALGLPFQALAQIPAIAVPVTSLLGLWYLVLLVSTAMSQTRQGLHDRMAHSAIVQPMGASAPAVACLVLLTLLVVIPLIAIVALIFLGAQVSSILSTVGTSVQP